MYRARNIILVLPCVIIQFIINIPRLDMLCQKVFANYTQRLDLWLRLWLINNAQVHVSRPIWKARLEKLTWKAREVNRATDWEAEGHEVTAPGIRPRSERERIENKRERQMRPR